MGACFSAVTQSPLDIITFPLVMLAVCSLLPLAVIAIFRPGFAARGIGLSWLLFLIAAFCSINWRATERPSLQDLAIFVTSCFALPGAIVTLLLFASSPPLSPGAVPVLPEVSGHPAKAAYGRAGVRQTVVDGSPLGTSGRKRLAKWVAVILGAGIGLLRFQTAWHLAIEAPSGLGWTAVGHTAPWLAAVPLAILGLWKPRWAAYGYWLCFLVLLSTPLRALRKLGDLVGFLLFPGMMALPLALVALLFYYASDTAPPDTADVP